MLQWTRVGAAHWFIIVGFGLLFSTLVNAYGQLFDPHFILPVIGHFPPFEWVTELFAWVMVVAIVPFMVYRATRPSDRTRGAKGRFYGSTMWQGYFVEWVILTVGLCILALRVPRVRPGRIGEPRPGVGPPLPAHGLGRCALDGLSEATLENLVLRRGDAQDRHLDDLDDHHRAEHHDGRRLAPVPRLPEHLVQAGGLGRASPWGR